MSEFNDDLLKAVGAFKTASNDLQITSAVNSAREQVANINSTISNEGEKRTALTGLANDLTMRLTAAQAPAAHIAAAFSAVAPPQYADAEHAALASDLNSSASLADAYAKAHARALTNEDQAAGIKDKYSGINEQREFGYKKQLQDDHLAALERIAAGKAGSKGSEKDDKVLGHLADTLYKDKNYVQVKGGSMLANDAAAALEMARTNPTAYNNLKVFMARMSNGGQRLNLPELEAQGGTEAWAGKVFQNLNKAKSGTLTDENYNNMKPYLDKLKETSAQNLEEMHLEAANRVSQRTSYDTPTAYRKITGRDLTGSSTAPVAPAAGGSSSALMTPSQLGSGAAGASSAPAARPVATGQGAAALDLSKYIIKGN